MKTLITNWLTLANICSFYMYMHNTNNDTNETLLCKELHKLCLKETKDFKIIVKELKIENK